MSGKGKGGKGLGKYTNNDDAAPAKSATLKQLKATIKQHNKKNCLLLSGSKATLADRIRKQPGLAMPEATKSTKKHRQKAPTVTKDQRVAARARARAKAATKAAAKAAKRNNAAVASVKLEPTSGYAARKGHFM